MAAPSRPNRRSMRRAQGGHPEAAAVLGRAGAAGSAGAVYRTAIPGCVRSPLRRTRPSARSGTSPHWTETSASSAATAGNGRRNSAWRGSYRKSWRQHSPAAGRGSPRRAQRVLVERAQPRELVHARRQRMEPGGLNRGTLNLRYIVRDGPEPGSEGLVDQVLDDKGAVVRNLVRDRPNRTARREAAP
jgi:hypothetical protein